MWSSARLRAPPFEAGALAATLRGGRALRMVGDSTMRQLFVAVACLLPPALHSPSLGPCGKSVAPRKPAAAYRLARRAARRLQICTLDRRSAVHARARSEHVYGEERR